MVQVNWISGFMVGIEFFSEDDDPIVGHGPGMILDLGIFRVIYEAVVNV